MVPSSPADVNARCVDVLACFFGDDQKSNVRKCGVKVACIHFGDELKYKNIRKRARLNLEGYKCQTKLLEEVVALTELTLNCRDRVRVY